MREGDEFEAFNPAFAIDDVVTKGDHHEGWILSVFHQLHCLVSRIQDSATMITLLTYMVSVYSHAKTRHIV
jgi:hypothetical protein